MELDDRGFECLVREPSRENLAMLKAHFVVVSKQIPKYPRDQLPRIRPD